MADAQEYHPCWKRSIDIELPWNKIRLPRDCTTYNCGYFKIFLSGTWIALSNVVPFGGTPQLSQSKTLLSFFVYIGSNLHLSLSLLLRAQSSAKLKAHLQVPTLLKKMFEKKPWEASMTIKNNKCVKSIAKKYLWYLPFYRHLVSHVRRSNWKKLAFLFLSKTILFTALHSSQIFGQSSQFQRSYW